MSFMTPKYLSFLFIWFSFRTLFVSWINVIVCRYKLTQCLNVFTLFLFEVLCRVNTNIYVVPSTEGVWYNQLFNVFLNWLFWWTHLICVPNPTIHLDQPTYFLSLFYVFAQSMLIYFIHPGFIICRPNFILVLIHRLHCQIDSIHPLDSPRPTSLSYATSFLWFPLFLIQPLSCVAVKTCNCVILTLLDLRLALSFPAWIVPTNALGCPHIVVCPLKVPTILVSPCPCRFYSSISWVLSLI